MSEEKTDFEGDFDLRRVWMVGECDPDISGYYDEDVRHLCANPGSDRSIESLIPVTDGKIHYRNKYCGLCNGLSTLMLMYWDVELACSTVIMFSDEDVLQKIEDNRCNLYYRQPDSIDVTYCEMPSYSISTCNETGKWKNYSEIVERGCNSFLDPFNATYKNYFCYLCNVPEKEMIPYENWKCDPFADLLTDVSPPFSAILGLGMASDVDKEKKLVCQDHNQFEDYKMVINYSSAYHPLRSYVQQKGHYANGRDKIWPKVA